MIFKVLVVLYLVNFKSDGMKFDCPTSCNCSILTMTTECQGKNFTEKPQRIFGLTENLDLSQNFLTVVPKDLSHLRNLQNLNLSHNQISVLDEYSFKGLKKLKIVNLSYNNFTDWSDIHEDTLIEMHSLKEIDISHNSFGDFPELLLQPIQSPTLEILHMNNCSLTNIFSDFLIRLPNLKEVYLKNNQFAVLNTQINATNLRKLDLSECSLERITLDAFSQMPALEVLLLTNNSGLRGFRSNSYSLKYLDLSHCNLEILPTGNWPKLEVADFGGNNFRVLTNSSLQPFPALKLLDISSNSLGHIEHGTFDIVPNLQEINLSSNSLTHLEKNIFQNSKNLKSLDLSRNYLTDFELKSNSINYLDLSVCEIRDVPKSALNGLHNLQHLNLSRNLIATLPDSWEAAQLISLDLSLCRIISINNITFKAMPKLSELNLSGNRLTSIAITQSFFRNINHLQLVDNPWYCDCTSQDMKLTYIWLSKLEHFSTPSCFSPENISGKKWENACESQWSTVSVEFWKYPSTVFLLAGSALLLVIIVIVHHYRQKERERNENNEHRQATLRHRYSDLLFRSMAENPLDQNPPSYAEALRMTRVTPSRSGTRQRQNNEEPSVSHQAPTRNANRWKPQNQANRNVNGVATLSEIPESNELLNNEIAESSF